MTWRERYQRWRHNHTAEIGVLAFAILVAALVYAAVRFLT